MMQHGIVYLYVISLSLYVHNMPLRCSRSSSSC